MNLRIMDEVYTGGFHYFIRFYNGNYSVVKDKDYYGCEVVFRGHYEACKAWLKDKIEFYEDFDLSI